MEEGAPTESEDTLASRKAAVASRHQGRYAALAAATEREVWSQNQTTELRNERIVEVLEEATGKQLGGNPKAWWDWWREHTGYDQPTERPVERQYYTDTDSYYYGQPTYDLRPPGGSSGVTIPVRAGGGFECFAKGTLVWAKTGQQPIESLQLGDLVLAQNVETGELAYKPVIGRTVRPPSPNLKMTFEGEDLLTTRGHPFWVAGVGWRMAKEIGDAAVLHAVTGSTRVNAVQEAGEAEAYNLVVADFNTYFVGEAGVLVHDNTPRQPTRATLPGSTAR
jgi:hypothetical protein